MEGPMSKKTNESPMRANHKGNIKLPNPLLSQEAYRIRKGKKKTLYIKIKNPSIKSTRQMKVQVDTTQRKNKKKQSTKIR
jgi:hypothetical protein